MAFEHRNQLLDLIPVLITRPNFEMLVRRIAAAGNVFDDVPGGASYNGEVEFVVDAAIERGWIKKLVEELVKEFPNRKELTPILKNARASSGTSLRDRWDQLTIPLKISLAAFAFGVLALPAAVLVGVMTREPTAALLVTVRIVAAVGGAALAGAVAGVVARRMAAMQCAIVMASLALAAAVLLLIFDPVRALMNGPIVLVRGDAQARALISSNPNVPSPYEVRVAGRDDWHHVPKSGLAVGFGPLSPQVIDAFHSVAKGEPTRYPVRIRSGATKLEVRYRGKPCTPLMIDPDVNVTSDIALGACPWQSSPP